MDFSNTKTLEAIFSLFNRFIVRDLLKNPVRFVITVLGIALGVGVLVAINLANHSVNFQFKQTVNQIAGRANLEIRPAILEVLDEKEINNLSWLYSLGGKLTPIINRHIVLPDYQFEQAEFLGVDLFSDPDFKIFGSKGFDKNGDKILEPQRVLIGSRLANRLHLQVGQSLNLLVDDFKTQVTIAEILPTSGIGGAYSGNLIIADLATAQEVLNMPHKISAIELIVPETIVDDVKEKLDNDLAKTLIASSPAQRGKQVEKLIQSFAYNLLALSFVALMVGIFLIYNTMSITVLRRKQEIGILRALGVNRLQIFFLFTLEVIIFGIVGSFLGVLLGVVLAHFTLGLISQTIQYFYNQEPVNALNIDWLLLMCTFIGGLLITILSSALPLVQATQVSAAEAVRRSSQTFRLFAAANKWALVGFIFLVITYIASLQPAVDDFPLFGYIAAISSISGLACFLPLALQKVLPLLAKLMNHANLLEFKIAALSLYGTLDRTAVAIASLMLGIAMMVSLAIMIGSFRDTVNLWIEQTLKADLWIQTDARANGAVYADISPRVIETVSKISGVQAIDTFVEIPITFNGKKSNLAAAEFDIIRKYGHLRFTSGKSCQEVFAHLKGQEALISETFAIHNNLKENNSIEIETPNGAVHLLIAAIYYDYASDLGYILIDRNLFSHLFNSISVNSCAVYLKPEANADLVRSKILQALKQNYFISIKTTRELKQEAIKIFDRTFSITYALHFIAVLVAMLAVMNALFALTIESRREFGLLKYLGASKIQIAKVILAEAGILSGIGNLTGIILGFILAFLLIYVINKQSFGWTILLTIPYEFLLQTSFLIVFTGLVSSLIPAYIAAKTLAPAAIRDE